MKTKSLVRFARLFVISQNMARGCGLDIACRPMRGRIATPAKTIPIADLYASLLSAVNRGDLAGAQQLAAQIAA